MNQPSLNLSSRAKSRDLWSYGLAGTNDETIFCVWGARVSRMLVVVFRRNELLCSILCHRRRGERSRSHYTDLHGSIGFVSIRVHSWLQLALRPVASSDSGRADQRNHLAFVPAVNAKILVGCDHAVVRIKLAHPDQTKIGQIGLPIGITFG